MIFYLPLLLSSLGSNSHASLEDALIIGGVNVASTVIAVALVDRLGRRPILIAGAHVQTESLAMPVQLHRTVVPGVTP